MKKGDTKRYEDLTIVDDYLFRKTKRQQILPNGVPRQSATVLQIRNGGWNI